MLSPTTPRGLLGNLHAVQNCLRSTSPYHTRRYGCRYILPHRQYEWSGTGGEGRRAARADAGVHETEVKGGEHQGRGVGGEGGQR